jgi:hypothetical protein
MAALKLRTKRIVPTVNAGKQPPSRMVGRILA